MTTRSSNFNGNGAANTLSPPQPETPADGGSIRTRRARSIQGRSVYAKTSAAGYLQNPFQTNILRLVSQVSDGVTPWTIYPHQRDWELRRFWKQEPILAGGIYSMSARIKALPHTKFDTETIEGKHAQYLWDSADFGTGGAALVAKTVTDLLTQDNGFFWELESAGSAAGPRRGPVLRVNHLDPQQCYRTFDEDYPVIYVDPFRHTIHKLHRTRVVFGAAMPQSNELARGLGFCGVSRVLLNAQLAKAITTYRYEKVAGKFTRAIGYGRGITDRSFRRAVGQAESQNEAQGFTTFSQIPFLTSVQGIELNVLNLASVPDGFDPMDETSLYVYILSLSFGVDAREFWPATASGATKADATIQNMKARGKGFADLISIIEWAWSHVLPAGVPFGYDFIDDEQDRLRAMIRETMINSYQPLLRDGVITKGVYRVILVRENALTKEDIALIEKEEAEEEAKREAEREAMQNEQEAQKESQPGQEGPPGQNDQENPNGNAFGDNNSGNSDGRGVPTGGRKGQPDSLAAGAKDTRQTSPQAGAQTNTPGGHQEAGPELELPLVMAVKNASSYRASIRANMRSLYGEHMTEIDFVNAMGGAVSRGLTQAFLAGATAGAGIKNFGELDTEERDALDDMIANELTYLPKLAEYITAAKSAEPPIPVTKVLQRADLWANTYHWVEGQGLVLTAKNKKLKWTAGNTKNPCWHSLTYRNKVYRTETWSKYLDPYDTWPQGRGLECRGYRCQCNVDVTDEKITPGHPAVWPGSKMSYELVLTSDEIIQGHKIIKGSRLLLVGELPDNTYSLLARGVAHLNMFPTPDPATYVRRGFGGVEVDQ